MSIVEEPIVESLHPENPERMQECIGVLDNMLGTLEESLSQSGVSTSYKGVCAQCEEALHDEVCTAFGKTWHPEHFLCVVCNAPLWQVTFYEREGKAYCEKDYQAAYSPRCEACNGIITDSCVMENERVWHIEHFKCCECKKPIGGNGFHEYEEKIYCKEDYRKLFLPKCPECKDYVSGVVLNKKWHPKCFKCSDCKESLEGRNFYDYKGKQYCETHFRAKRRNICEKCKKLILRQCITAMGGKKFHPDHFICTLCTYPLNQGKYKVNKDKPYCERCYLKKFMVYY